MQSRQLLQVWEIHSSEDWPVGLGSNEGELMMIDTVVSGCATYYLESPEGLDEQRIAILESCLDDLENLMSDVEESALPYFQRLQTLGHLMLNTLPENPKS